MWKEYIICQGLPAQMWCHPNKRTTTEPPYWRSQVNVNKTLFVFVFLFYLLNSFNYFQILINFAFCCTSE